MQRDGTFSVMDTAYQADKEIDQSRRPCDRHAKHMPLAVVKHRRNICSAHLPGTFLLSTAFAQYMSVRVIFGALKYKS